jgi:hypothetical protein
MRSAVAGLRPTPPEQLHLGKAYFAFPAAQRGTASLSFQAAAPPRFGTFYALSVREEIPLRGRQPTLPGCQAGAGYGETLCENPAIPNRVTTGGQNRAIL